jgi:hypothetical protein
LAKLINSAYFARFSPCQPVAVCLLIGCQPQKKTVAISQLVALRYCGFLNKEGRRRTSACTASFFAWY